MLNVHNKKSKFAVILPDFLLSAENPVFSFVLIDFNTLYFIAAKTADMSQYFTA